MIFLSRKNSRFLKMIRPEAIDVSTENDYTLFVLDKFGTTYYIVFPNHESLAAAMSQLSNYGSCRCVVEDFGLCYDQTKNHQYDDDQDRQIEYNDIDMEIER